MNQIKAMLDMHSQPDRMRALLGSPFSENARARNLMTLCRNPIFSTTTGAVGAGSGSEGVGDGLAFFFVWVIRGHILDGTLFDHLQGIGIHDLIPVVVTHHRLHHATTPRASSMVAAVPWKSSQPPP